MENKPKDMLKEVKRWIALARKYEMCKDNATTMVFNLISELNDNVDLEDIATGAENADNLEEAICCYIDYGEYTIDELIAEITSAVTRKEINNG